MVKKAAKRSRSPAKKTSKKVKGKPLVTHNEVKLLTEEMYILGVVATILSVGMGIFTLCMVNLYYGPLKYVYTTIGAPQVLVFASIAQLMIGCVYIIGAILAKKEHHILGASIVFISAGIIGMIFFSGFFLGALLAFIAGLLGLSEYEKLIKHHV